MALFINEIFYSIQGESLYSGLPCVFIRLSGCNLRCSYCDTSYAYNEGFYMQIPEIIKHIQTYNRPLTEITGGEPLLQSETPLLVYNLLEQGYEVIMETNGSFDIGILDRRCIKIIDIKCPSSNESAKNNLQNIKKMSKKDQLKFVIGNYEDYYYAKNIVKSECAEIYGTNILFSPVFKKLNPANLAEWILEDKLKARLHLQLHKIIWSDIERGV